MQRNKNTNGVSSENGGKPVAKVPPFRSIVLSLISLGLIAAFIYYLYANADKYLSLLRVSPLPVISIFLLSLTTPFLSGMINVYMFRNLGASLSHREGLFLAAVSNLANQLPVSGGIVTKGVYLKYKYAISYTKYFSAMLAVFFCTISVYGFLGEGILLYWVIFENVAISPLLLIAFGVMAAGLVIFWLPLDYLKIPNVLLKWFNQALEGWTLFSNNPILLLKLLGIQFTMMLLFAIRYWLAFHMLSQNVTVGQVILFSSATVLTQLVSFAPGGLGVREAVVAGIASELGFDAGTSVVAVGLDRLISTVAIMLAGWIGTVALGKQISAHPMKSKAQDK